MSTSTSLKPMQVLVLWALIVQGGKGLQKDIRPRITKPLRDSLERAGLIVSRKNDKRAIVIEVTDKGWAWASENLDAELPARSTAAGPIMQAFLTQLKSFLRSRNLVFAEIFMAEEGGEAQSEPDTALQPASAEDIKKRVREAYFSLTKGQSKQRIRLHQLRQELPNIKREELDRALLEMQQKEELVLIALANKQDITRADRVAALKVGGNPRHVVYFGV